MSILKGSLVSSQLVVFLYQFAVSHRRFDELIFVCEADKCLGLSEQRASLGPEHLREACHLGILVLHRVRQHFNYLIMASNAQAVQI